MIAKIIKDGNRTSEKERITEEKYEEFLSSSILHLEKKRYEFSYIQSDISFSLKYDEFAGDKPYMLEADAASEEEKEFFSPDEFPAELTEVTGDTRYYGYRVAS